MTRGSLLVIFPYLQRQTTMSLATPQELKTGFPLTWEYLVANKGLLDQREDGTLRGAYWFTYSRNQALDVVSLPKIFTPDIAPRGSFSLDEIGDIFFTGGVAGGYGLLAAPPYSPKFLLGLLNSRLLDWMLKRIATSMRGGYYSFESRFIRDLPIRPIDFTNPADKTMHDEMVRLVEQMLVLHRQLATAGTDREKSGLQLQIAALDRAIDSLVFRLYDISPDEVRSILSLP